MWDFHFSRHGVEFDSYVRAVFSSVQFHLNSVADVRTVAIFLKQLKFQGIVADRAREGEQKSILKESVESKMLIVSAAAIFIFIYI